MKLIGKRGDLIVFENDQINKEEFVLYMDRLKKENIEVNKIIIAKQNKETDLIKI